jgi:hypothetical protein
MPSLDLEKSIIDAYSKKKKSLDLGVFGQTNVNAENFGSSPKYKNYTSKMANCGQQVSLQQNFNCNSIKKADTLTIHDRLSNSSSFTSTYKNKYKNSDYTDVSGDFIPSPIKACRLLAGTPCNELTMRGRACDFGATVQFRMYIRSHMT